MVAYQKKPFRKNYRRSSTNGRKSIVKVPPKKRTQSTYVRSNARAVNRLAADVRYLKQARYGAVQKNLQIFSTAVVPTATQPVFFVCNNIQATNPLTGAQGCPMYQLNAAGASTIVSRFIQNDNTYFDKMNDDVIDGGIASISAIRMCFRIFCNPDSTNQISNKRLRIDIFKQKSRSLVTPSTIGDIQQLPAVAAQNKLLNMANPTLNMWNNEYFHRIGSKYVFLNPSKTSDVNKGTGAALKYVSMSVPYKYLGRVTQQTTNPTFGDSPQQPGWDIDNMPISQRIWVMISSDDPNTFPASDPEIQVQCQRYVQWRDRAGSAALT